MDVAVKTSEATDAATRKKILVVNKDFAQGEVIYKVGFLFVIHWLSSLIHQQEKPVVAVLDFDVQGKGTHCSHCLRQVQKGVAIRVASDPFDSVYCSKDCQINSKTQSQNLLFSLESPLPAAIAPLMPRQTLEERKNAQMAFLSYIKRVAKAAPLLVARFVARQVAVESATMIPGATPVSSTDLPEIEAGQYSLYDHVERLRFLESSASEEEMNLLRNVFQTALPGLEQFVTDERHGALLGKMAYNMYGVCFGGGRDDKVRFSIIG
jgi:import receptor subunit TOM20